MWRSGRCCCSSRRGKSLQLCYTPYIMAEHPGLTANEAITESRRIMDGNKWRLFCLDPQLSGLGAALHPAHADWFLSRLCLHPLGGYGPCSADLLSIPLSAGFFFLTPTRKRPGRSFTGISPLHLLTPRKSENETYRLLSPARTVRVLRALPPVPAPVPGAPGIFL